MLGKCLYPISNMNVAVLQHSSVAVALCIVFSLMALPSGCNINYME